MTKTLTCVVVLVCSVALTYVLYPPDAHALKFPNGKAFAFSIIDDTDMVMLDRIAPMYALLEKYGFRTTKTVWVLETSDRSYGPNRGESLRNPAYRQFVVDLQRKGFEIALHGVRGGSSRRADVIAGLEEFKAHLGRYPTLHVNHSLNKENLYWGPHLFSFAPYRWLSATGMRKDFHGEEEDSEYFWGDVARQHVRYVSRFTFPGINLRSVNPSIPYRLPDKPYVNYWFPTSNGDHVKDFDDLLKPENLDRLAREGGVCLVYAHLGSGSFTKNGSVDPRFEARLKDIASRNGWLVPASEILDYLTTQPGWSGDLSFRERLRVETLFLSGQFLKRL